MIAAERFAQGLAYPEFLLRLENKRRVEAFYALLPLLPALPGVVRVLALVEE